MILAGLGPACRHVEEGIEQKPKSRRAQTTSRAILNPFGYQRCFVYMFVVSIFMPFFVIAFGVRIHFLQMLQNSEHTIILGEMPAF